MAQAAEALALERLAEEALAPRQGTGPRVLGPEGRRTTAPEGLRPSSPRAPQVGASIGRQWAEMPKSSIRPSLRWRLAGAVHWLPDVRGRDRLTRLLTNGQPAPPGVHVGTFGPDLRYRVRYQDDGSLIELFFLQYEKPCLAPVFEASLAPGSCFFDVGANIGIYSAWASRLVTDSGQVHAFEPIPSTRQFLKDILAYNAIGNVHIESTALGNVGGELRLYRPEGASGIATAAMHKDGEPFDVEMTTMDRYIAESGCPIPALVKIDVEGFELPVLRGARRLLRHPDAPVVVYETHKDVEIGGFRQTAELFQRNGYQLFGLCTSGLRLITDIERGPLSLNTLAAHPERHRDVIQKLRNVRFRRNQNV